MRILVLVKETFTTEAKIVLKDPATISDEEVKYVINPYDELAIEEALRLREKCGGEVIIYTVAREEAQSTIRNGLALGADKAKIIVAKSRDTLLISKLLAENICQEEYDLILAGWIAIDDNNAQVPVRLSELLGVPCVNVVTKLEYLGEKVLCHREKDEIVEIIEVGLPVIITVQRGINEPRYPTVRNILQAKKKPLEFISCKEEAHKAKDVSYYLTEAKRARLIITGEDPHTGVKQLIAKLKEARAL